MTDSGKQPMNARDWVIAKEYGYAGAGDFAQLVGGKWVPVDKYVLMEAYAVYRASEDVARLTEIIHASARTETAYHETMEARVKVLEDALRGVVRVADRKTTEFDAARAALGI